MRRFCFVMAVLLANALAFASPDSLMVDVRGATGTLSFQSPTGIWWPVKVGKQGKSKWKPVNNEYASKSPVVVWFHGGMGSSNCAKGLEAGASFADFYPGNIVVSVSAWRESRWGTKG